MLSLNIGLLKRALVGLRTASVKFLNLKLRTPLILRGADPPVLLPIPPERAARGSASLPPWVGGCDTYPLGSSSMPLTPSPCPHEHLRRDVGAP